MGQPVPSTNIHGEAASPRRPLTGRAADIAKRAADRRQAATEHLAEFQAFAKLMVAALGGIDAIRSRLGREDALRVAALAGLPVEQIAGQWSASDPGSTRQVSRVRPDHGYDTDPAHDQRVVDAIMAGAPMEEVGRVRAEVTAEYAARRAAARASTRGGSDSAIPGVRYADGIPVQRTGPGNTDAGWDPVEHRLIARPQPDIWADLPDYQPGFQDRTSAGIGSNGMPGPVPGAALPGASVTECDHDAQTGKFCAACGTPLAAGARG
jgi:hypothetical protein